MDEAGAQTYLSRASLLVLPCGVLLLSCVARRLALALHEHDGCEIGTPPGFQMEDARRGGVGSMLSMEVRVDRIDLRCQDAHR